MPFTAEQKAMLDADLDAAHVQTRQQAGQKLSYIEAWRAIAEANRIFGHDGWTRETVEMRMVREPAEVDGKWRVGFMCRVRVRAGGVERDGIGYGSGIARDLGDAIESAVKEAESDATKRSLSTFGWPLGLALYDKSREHVGRSEPTTTAAPPEQRNTAYKTAMQKIAEASDLYALQLILDKAREFWDKGRFTDSEHQRIQGAVEERRGQLHAKPVEETDEMRNLRAG